MLLSSLILVFQIIVNFVFAIFGAYYCGLNIGAARKNKIKPGISTALSYVSLGMSFFIMAYVIATVISYMLFYLNYIPYASFVFATSFSFLVFGLMIITFGLPLAINAVLVYKEHKNVSTAFGAFISVAFEVLNIYKYVQGFKDARSALKMSNEWGSKYGIEIIISAFLAAFVLIYVNYKRGINDALDGRLAQGKQNVQGGV